GQPRKTEPLVLGSRAAEIYLAVMVLVTMYMYRSWTVGCMKAAWLLYQVGINASAALILVSIDICDSGLVGPQEMYLFL
ncbi:unnamed protein product, partial [Urochloa humidicola]